MLGVKNPSSRPGKAELCAVTTCGGESSERHTQCAPIVLVEGNIGAGKTTLIRELSEKLGFRVFLEPTAKNPYLAKFYADPKKYALKLQLWIFRQRFLTYVDAVRHVLEKGQGVLLDRSVFSDCVFADVGFQDGNISEEGFSFYNQLRHACLSKVPPPHAVVFLDATPQTCRDRITARGRDCEAGIPVSYLASLHDAYRTFLPNMEKLGCDVIKCDWEMFGSTSLIVSRLRQMACLEWPASLDTANISKFVRNRDAVRSLLTLPAHLQDEDDKENILFGSDCLQDMEEKLHKQESVKLKPLKESVSAANRVVSARPYGSMVKV